MKNSFIIVSILITMGQTGICAAYDSGPQTLGPAVGSTDYYRMSCSSSANEDTDHIDFGITDDTLISAEVPVLNVRVTKNLLSAEESAIAPGKTRELFLQEGNGKYRISINTQGTNPALTAKQAKQSYTLSFQCLNADNIPTKASKKKVSAKINRNKVKNYPVKCSRKKKPGDTDRILVKISNTTKSGQVLMAQLMQGRSATNLTDGNQVSFRDGRAKNGNGDYYLMVDNTGTNSGQDNSKQYSFSARCVNAQGDDTVEPIVDLLQDR